jgi:hypothetical protein
MEPFLIKLWRAKGDLPAVVESFIQWVIKTIGKLSILGRYVLIFLT